MSRASTTLAALAALAVLAAGCGSAGGGSGGVGGSASSNAVYTAKATVPCLRTKGFTHVTTNPDKIGFIAGFAPNGGLKAASPSKNLVTIAFVQDSSGVAGTKRAFRRNATGIYKRHIRDVMESQGNAVLVWTETPSPAELNDVLGCLQK